ncbi:MAG: polysaccharide biosynthesis tyrosine autokinase [Verrucomicrobia bacterium]|nr:polysaccharide biosynthesis tyrosine autokinase [Verrucomicrobiota bacterium]
MSQENSGEAKLHFLDYWRVIKIRLPLILLVFLLVVITAWVVTYFLPKQYASSVTMQIKQNDTYLRVFDDRGGGQGFDPRFITTQFEIIQRKEILYPVIESLGLEQKWKKLYGTAGKEQAFFRLRKMIDVREIRNTELIQIVVMSQDPQEAADIANRIAEEYRDRRVSEQQKLVSSSLFQLQEEVAKQSRKVDELRAEAQRIRVENQIQDLNPDSVEDPMQAANEVLLSVEQQVSAERLKVSSLRAKYEQISRLTDDQIMRSITTLDVQDPTIQQMLPQFQEVSSEEARVLNSGLGPNHPTVKSIRAKKAVMENQLAAQISSLRASMEANLLIAEESLKELEKRLKESQSEQQVSKTRASGYYEAKNNYIQAKRLLEAAELRLSTEAMQRTMPQDPATIWERAEPSNIPASPRILLNMILGVVVGIGFAVGLAFFIEYLDTSVKTMEEVETLLQVPVLSVIPKDISLLIRQPDDHPDAEAYRIMRTNIEFNRKSPSASTITLVSGGAGEGKSTTLNNLAYTFAKGGYTTLIVDADLRRPSQHTIFGVQNSMGLSDFLTKEVSLEDTVHATQVDNLYLMTSGEMPRDAVGVLNSQRMLDLIKEVKGRFDIAFFDSPPILGVSDASVLSSEMDLTIIVVQHRRFPKSMLQRVKQAVENVGGNILGVVLNNVDVRHDQYYEYYTSYYNYYHKPAGKGSKSKADAQAKKGPLLAASTKKSDTNEGEY